MRPSEIAVRRARVHEPIETPELPVQLDDRPFTPPTITRAEFVDAQLPQHVADRPHTRSNTREAMAILGLRSRQGLYKLNSILKPDVVYGQLVYDLDRVRCHARENRMQGGYVRLAEAAAIVGVSSQTLARWTREGRITAVEATGARAYRVRDLEALAAEVTP